jgi:hypothetical protein
MTCLETFQNWSFGTRGVIFRMFRHIKNMKKRRTVARPTFLNCNVKFQI